MFSVIYKYYRLKNEIKEEIKMIDEYKGFFI